MDDEVLQRIDPAMRSYIESGGFAGISVVVVRGAGVNVGGSVRPARQGGRPSDVAGHDLPHLLDDEADRGRRADDAVRRGRVALTDPVAEYLPAFRRTQVASADGRLSDPARPLLVSDLLTHTGGFTNELQATPVAALYRDVRLHNDPTRSLPGSVDEVSRLPLAFQPGTRWHYGTGLDVAARVVELVADQPFGAVLQERIFAPLGMTYTAFGVPERDLDRLAAMYGLPDVFANGLSLADVAAAADSGSNERRDVSATHPTAAPDVFVRGGFGLLLDGRGLSALQPDAPQPGRARCQARACRLHCRPDVPQPPARRAAAIRADGRDVRPWSGFGLGPQVMLDVEAAGGCGSIGEHGWAGAAKTHFWLDPRRWGWSGGVPSWRWWATV
jgi:CubicO group peptidase (beta-lactamase class C family)